MVISLMLAIPLRAYNMKFLKALLALPKAFFVMFSLMFKLKGANQKFIHTEHGETKEAEIEKQKD